MQFILKNRLTLTGHGTVFTAPVEVSGYSLLTGALIVYAVGGTGPVLNVSLETSDDLETWNGLGTVFSTAAAVIVRRASWPAGTQKYGSYVRAKIVVSGVAAPVFNFSLYLNAFDNE